jgi:formylglycine-generating enzyme required for sulfatase activity
MDQSFRNWDLDSYQGLLERIAEARRGRNRAEPRAVLLTHLLAEDPAYREYFKRVFQQIMNHRLTDAFLQERYRFYADTAVRFEVQNLSYLRTLKEFLERRPAFFRLITEQWLDSPPSQPITIEAPAGVTLMIDGEPVTTGYRGLYFPDLDVTVDVAPEHRRRLSGWRVNGTAVTRGSRLVIRAERPTHIEAVFGQDLRTVAAAARRDAAEESANSIQVSRPHPEWRTIPAGSFVMGCVPDDPRCDPSELPRVRVTVTEPFEMMAHEVTAGDFQAYAANASQHMPRQPEWYANARHPVVNVTWDEAQAYCIWMGGRLPTEEQWEYAARGGLEGQMFPWGNDPTQSPNIRLFPLISTPTRTHPVGIFKSNGYGLYDMSGNVWEWTVSRHRPTHDTDAPESGYDQRTIKGGSWDSAIGRRRVSERVALARYGRHNLYVGFRCIRSVGPSS